MRTKTMLLSALLGAVGCVSAMAQTNVYSANAVGYVNVTLYPGFNLVSDPLIAKPNNAISNLLVNTNGQWKGWNVISYNPLNGIPYSQDSGIKAAWANGGTNTINPGQAVWIQNPSNSTLSITFVGTVPTSVTTPLYHNSFNLIGSAIPASGDFVTNSLMIFSNATKNDNVITYNPTLGIPYTQYSALGKGITTNWASGNPQIPWVGAGFWYQNTAGTNNQWVQNYSVSQ
jgi:hypothetical protein